MKKIVLSVSLIVVFALLASCSQTAVEVEEAVLTVGGGDYARSELEDLGSLSADYTNKDGETTTYSGIPLNALLEDANLTSGGGTLVFTASDGYETELSLEEALACADCIVAFDDGTLRLVMPEFSSKLQVKDLVEIKIQ